MPASVFKDQEGCLETQTLKKTKKQKNKKNQNRLQEVIFNDSSLKLLLI